MLDARRVAVAVLLIAVAAVTGWLAQRADDPERVAAPPAEAPDYVIERFTTQGFDTDGRLKHRLMAERLTHFPRDDSSDLVKPYLIQYFPARAPVHTRAETGRLTNNETRLLMEGKVHSSRGRDPKGAGADIVADTMLIELDQPKREGAAKRMP
jgi:lipopolysaccharide export system protein LptC